MLFVVILDLMPFIQLRTIYCELKAASEACVRLCRHSVVSNEVIAMAAYCSCKEQGWGRRGAKQQADKKNNHNSICEIHKFQNKV